MNPLKGIKKVAIGGFATNLVVLFVIGLLAIFFNSPEQGHASETIAAGLFAILLVVDSAIFWSIKNMATPDKGSEKES